MVAPVRINTRRAKPLIAKITTLTYSFNTATAAQATQANLQNKSH